MMRARTKDEKERLVQGVMNALEKAIERTREALITLAREIRSELSKRGCVGYLFCFKSAYFSMTPS